jgi:hypothetical protein
MLDASLRSESLYVPLVAFTLLAAYRLLDRPSAASAALLGLLIALCSLTRSEALALLLLLGVPVLWAAARGRARLVLAAAMLGGCLVLVGPWLARNWIAFNRPTAISTNEGGLLAGANCDFAYYGPLIGTWPCFPHIPASWGTNEAVISARLRRQAYHYARDHAGRVPVVVGVRVLRTWDVYQPGPQSRLEAQVNDRDLHSQQAGVAMLYVLAALSAYGFIVLRHRGSPLAPLVAPLVLVTLVAATSYGETRFRAAAEISLLVLASTALVELYERRTGTAGGASGAGSASAPSARV